MNPMMYIQEGVHFNVNFIFACNLWWFQRQG